MGKEERLDAVYRHLMSMGIVHTRRDMARKIEVSEQHLSGAFSGNPKNLTDNLFRRIDKAFPGMFQKGWLYDGSGEMLAEANPKEPSNSLTGVVANMVRGIVKEEIEGVRNSDRSLFDLLEETREQIVLLLSEVRALRASINGVK